MQITQYDIVELTKDLNPNIAKGTRGVILELWSNDRFEVEFIWPDGRNVEFEGHVTFTIDSSYIEIVR